MSKHNVEGRHDIRPTYLDTAFLFPPKLDLAEFTLSNCIAENIFAEFGVLLSLGMIVPASMTAAAFLSMIGSMSRHSL